MNESTLIRAGVLAIFMVATSGGGELAAAQWNIPVQLDFPRDVVGIFSTELTAVALKQIQGFNVHLGQFSSTLKLFRAAEFKDERTVAVFQSTQHAFAEQRLVGDGLHLSFLRAWLSDSSAAEASAIHTLDAEVLQEGLGGVVRIKAQMMVCPDCYLHILSKVEMTGSRLLEEHYSADYIAVQVPTPQVA